jgi:hypothetical protein
MRRATLFLTMGLLVSTAFLFGDDATGALVGTVADPAGAVVVDATVTVRNLETGSLRKARTNAVGDFVIALLPPGFYEVVVEAAGFRRFVRRPVKLEVGETGRVDFQLQLGSLAQEVVVTGSPPLVETDDAAIGQVISQRKMGQLPLNERRFLTFALLVPGAHAPVDGSENSTSGGAISVNGAREQSNYFLLDGADNTFTGHNQYAVLPSVDAIQEFKVQSSSLSAEYGRVGGAQINIAVKSGTNDFHGTVFDFLRNRHLDAKNVFDSPACDITSVPGTCGDIPRYDRQQYGATLGGPIRRNRTSFFASYEGLNLHEATTGRATVPSQAQRAAVLSAVPPAQRNPAGEAAMALYPAANVGADLLGSQSFVSAPVIDDSWNQFLVKVNHQIGERHLFSALYAFFDENRFNPINPFSTDSITNLPGFGVRVHYRGQNFNVSWIRVASPHLTNEAKFGFSGYLSRTAQENSGTNGNLQLGFPTVMTEPASLGYPIVEVAGFDGLGDPISNPNVIGANSFQWSDHVAWIPTIQQGRHQIRFGAEYRHVDASSVLRFFARGRWEFLGVFTGNPLEDLLRGLPAFAIGVRGVPYQDSRQDSDHLSLYVQDQVRMGARVRLTAGLRYEYNRPPIDATGSSYIPDLSANSANCTPRPDCQYVRAGAAGTPAGGYESDFNNVAPRVGIAWRPLGDNRTVVRAGYGVFYDGGLLARSAFLSLNPPSYTIAVSLNRGASTIQDILNQPGFTPFAFLIQPRARESYVQHWHLDLQREILSDLVLDLGYVGSKGTKLIAVRGINQADPATGARPFPQFGVLAAFESRASSSYHSLQCRAEKRFSGGLAFLAAYTWSRSIDDASALFGSRAERSFLPQDSNNLIAERGLSSFHAKHRFVLSYLYELPVGTGHRWLIRRERLNRIFGGWTLAGVWTFQSGQPFSVNRAVDQSGSGTIAFVPADRPDLIADPFRSGPVPSNPDPACYVVRSAVGRAADAVRTPDTWFNPCAFAPAPGKFGSAGRNILLGPGLAVIDFSLLKDIPLRKDSWRLQFRVEFFNLLNRPNFDLPDNVFDSATFSQVRSANAFGTKPPRQIQLGLKYIF